MKITKLKRLDECNVECSLEYNGRQCTAIVNLFVDGDIRALRFEGVSAEEKRHLYNVPEGRDLTRQLWRFFDGEELTLPIELRLPANSDQIGPACAERA